MNDLSLTPIAQPPAPLTPGLNRRLDIAMNGVEVEVGGKWSIGAAEALSPDDRSGLTRRVARLVSALSPCGPTVAATALASMRLMMISGGSSSTEADVSLKLWIENLADLPAFAIEAATRDFLRGEVGERGFVPKLPVFRQHVIAKASEPAAERRRIEKLLAAHAMIRPPRASAERRAEVVAIARNALKGMRQAGIEAEAERAGRIADHAPPPSLDTPDQILARLAALRNDPIAPLSTARSSLHTLRCPRGAEPWVSNRCASKPESTTGRAMAGRSGRWP